MEESIRIVAGLCEEARTARHSEHRVRLSFDEWNIWYHFQKEGVQPPKWTVARPIEEERFDDADTLLVGCMLNTLLRSADVVKIACLAQLVNVIAPIMTEPGGRAWVQGIYYPFLYTSAYGRGTALLPEVEVPCYDCAVRNRVPWLDCGAVENDGGVTLFLINRSETEALDTALSLEGFGPLEPLSLATLKGTELQPLPCAPAGGSRVEFQLPPFSWSLLRLHR